MSTSHRVGAGATAIYCLRNTPDWRNVAHTPHIRRARRLRGGDPPARGSAPGPAHRREAFLEGSRQVTAVRNMLGFTGTYKGMAVSAMGTGMGIPSASIYATELITEYGVKRLVRVGSCGGITTKVKLRDVIVAIGACTDSGVNRARYHGWDFAAIADFNLARAAVDAAAKAGCVGGGRQRPFRRPLLQPLSRRVGHPRRDERAGRGDGGGRPVRALPPKRAPGP